MFTLSMHGYTQILTHGPWPFVITFVLCPFGCLATWCMGVFVHDLREVPTSPKEAMRPGKWFLKNGNTSMFHTMEISFNLYFQKWTLL